MKEATKIRLSELQAEASEALFRGLLESAPDAILIVNRDGRIVMVNTQMEKMFGYTRDELLNQPVEMLLPEHLRRAHVGHRTEYVAAPHTRPMGIGLDLLGERKDGSLFSIEISLSPLRIATEMLVTAIIRDITDRKRAEETLQQAHSELELRVRERTAELMAANEVLRVEVLERKRAQEKLVEQAALLNQTLEAIVSCDLDGRILFWNHGAELVYGWTADEVVGRNLENELFRDELPHATKAKGELFTTGRWTGELRQFTKSGRPLTIEGHWTLVRDMDDRPKSILIVNYDITEKKSLEAQFLRAQRMESIGRLASGIAHDLNNILSPVLMGAQMLQMKLPDAGDQRLLEVMRGNIERGAEMIKQILLFARGVQGERIPLQPKHLIKEIIKVLSETLPKSIQVRSSIPEEPWLILGDATQIHQVLMNLCVNARDAMPRGGTMSIRAVNVRLDEVYVRMNPDAAPGDYVLITVADTGEGIPSHIIAKIFDPFFTTKGQGKGTGLGLSTVQGIVKSHGGFVNVYSEPGRGTEFKIYLPVAESPLARAESIETAWPSGHGELILVIDDESAVREMARNTLETFGYRVLMADNGAEAVAIYAQCKDEIAAVLTDLMMPVMDGPATIHALRTINPAVRIIASSGLAANGRMMEAAHAGVKMFLPKPYTAERLLKVVAEVLTE